MGDAADETASWGAPSLLPWNFPSHNVVGSVDTGSLSGFRSRPITSGVLLDNLLLLSRPQCPPLYREGICSLQCRGEDDRSQYREHVTLPAQGKDLAKTRAPGGAQQPLSSPQGSLSTGGQETQHCHRALSRVSSVHLQPSAPGKLWAPWWPRSCLQSEVKTELLVPMKDSGSFKSIPLDGIPGG